MILILGIGCFAISLIIWCVYKDIYDFKIALDHRICELEEKEAERKRRNDP